MIAASGRSLIGRPFSWLLYRDLLACAPVRASQPEDRFEFSLQFAPHVLRLLPTA